MGKNRYVSTDIYRNELGSDGLLLKPELPWLVRKVGKGTLWRQSGVH